MECCICLETLECVAYPKCEHYVCISCFKRCFHGKKHKDNYMSDELDDNINDTDDENEYENEKNLRLCPICRQ